MIITDMVIIFMLLKEQIIHNKLEHSSDVKLLDPEDPIWMDSGTFVGKEDA